MCIRIYIHRTSAAHDKRFHAVLNPATGYTVLSPFQDPVVDSCSSPCIEHPSRSPQTWCPWHAGCCNFDQYDLCNKPESCISSIKYHHFLSREAPNFSVGALRPYMVDPKFPSHMARFFKAGVELNLALAKLPELKSSLDRLGISGLTGDAAVNKARIASRWYHYQHIKLYSMAFLVQLALYWDMKVESKLWPPRPGREVFPELNCFNDSDAYLRVVAVGKMDFDPRGEWPHISRLWPNFVESLSSFSDEPHYLPWTLDLESGTWKAATDVSWTYNITRMLVRGPRSHSATESVSASPEQPESPESSSEPKQEHDEQQHSEQSGRQRLSSLDPFSIEPRTPIRLPAAFNNPPKSRRRTLLRYRKRSYRHMCRPVTSRRHLKRRSYSSRSKRKASSEPITLSGPEIRDEEGRGLNLDIGF
ncbi:hypothetical protein F4680DRAFT_434591 [Xylaria scruposa]|nr:hypothetical protein F4680DRAFT_434591 [Xylaria scruposa]